MESVLRHPRTINEMEEMLIVGHDLWWRTPDAGRGSPFAKDGPWNLGQFEAGDVASLCSLTLMVTDSGREMVVMKLDTPRPRSALTSREVAARDRIDGWVEMIHPDNRALVREVTLQAWRGHRRDWATVARRVNTGRTVSGLRMHYRGVMAQLVCRVNDVPVRFAKQLRARDGVLSHPAMSQDC